MLTRLPVATPFLLSLTLPLLLAPAARTQEIPSLTWQGEIRPRIEIREPVDGEWDQLTSMRARIGLRARFEGGLGVFFQVQDVRSWGEEASVRDRAADALDFHQAFLEVEDVPVIGGMIRAGRQEVDLGESRLLGAPDWGQAGQTFDGGRWIRPMDDQRFELIYLQIRENSAPAHEENEAFLAATYVLPLGSGGQAQAYLVHDRDSEPDQTRQTSLGGIWKKEANSFVLRLQGVYQSGRRQGQEVEANLLALSGSMRVFRNRGTVTLWYDRLSGDDDPGNDTVEAFSTLFGARNRFYGRADYFVDIPAATQGLGLQDAAVKLSYTPTPQLSMNLDVHSFRTSAEGNLSSRRLGEEADVWIRYRFRDRMVVQGGYSLIWAGPGMKELEILEGRGNFGYLMTSLRF